MKPASLSRSRDFRRVYDEGRRSRRDGIAVVATERGDRERTRIGFSVRSSAGGAVRRNRIKRRLRSAVAAVDVVPGFDVIVSGDASVASMDFQVLVETVDKVAGAVGVSR